MFNKILIILLIFVILVNIINYIYNYQDYNKQIKENNENGGVTIAPPNKTNLKQNNINSNRQTFDNAADLIYSVPLNDEK